MIDGLHSYDDIQVFLELFDMTTIIESITSEACWIEKQLNRHGMYPLFQTPLPFTSGFIPRPSPKFKPITPAAPSLVPGRVAANPAEEEQNNGTSPGTSLPGGQGKPTALAMSTNSTPPYNHTTLQGTPPNSSQAYTLPQNAASWQPLDQHHSFNSHHMLQLSNSHCYSTHNFQDLMLSQNSNILHNLM